MIKFRVLHCLETIGPGGVEQRRLSIARYLDHEKFSLYMTCSKVIGDFDKRLSGLGMEVVPIGVMKSPFNLGYYRRLFRVIRRVRPHIIHGAVFEGVISAIVGGMWGGVPIIIIEETSEPANRSWRGHFLLRFLSRFADAVVAISPAVYDYLTIILRIPEEKCHLILNGAEPPEHPEETEVERCKSALGLKSGQFVVGSVGRLLDDHKLYSVLIKAFGSFAVDKPDVRLLLVGDGPDREMLDALVTQLHLEHKVIFAGHQENVSPYFSMMDLFALVSAREGFGMAAVEAMFFGLPVVATRVGGLKQVVEEGVTGILIEPHQEAPLSDALQHLYADRGMASRMGQAGYDRAISKFTSRRYVADVASLYQTLINEKLRRIQ